ncbi:MAG: DUF3048 domain-containing protein, partial [Bacillota bacterium]|nr:DUF3048 domain-containing protein [Bacillota bacterium]
MNRNFHNNKTFNGGGSSGKKLLAALLLLLAGSLVGYFTLNVGQIQSSNGGKSLNPALPVANVPSTPEHEGVTPKGNISPYTGQEISNDAMNNIPFMTIIENSRPARPQSGLSQADIVFETMAEGGIPRFIALFHSSSPKEIGPVRSARPYFVMLAKEYNLPFGHCGGSEEALDKIDREHLMSMNEFDYGSYYWRDKSRKAPHNLYTSAEKLRTLITNKKFVQKPISSLKFSKDYWEKSFNKAEKINMNLNQYYSTSYDYRDGLYYKSMDGTAAVDKSNGNAIAVTNIVIQFTEIHPIANDDKGRIEI